MIRTHVTKDGKTRYRVRVGTGQLKSFKTIADARAYEAAQVRARERERAGLTPDKGPITYGELVKLYEANFDPSVWTSRMLAYGTAKWGRTPVRSLTPEGIGAWLHRLPLSDKTKNHVVTAMRQALSAGVRWGYLSHSPAQRGGFKVPKGERVREIRPFESWEEVEAVAEQMPYAGHIVRFVCATGLRTPGEWIDLTAGDFDLKGKTLRVSGTKTEAAARTIPLSPRALAALEGIAWPISPRERIFKGKNGGRFDYCQWRKDWHSALALLGMEDRTPYEMRHTAATLLAQAGITLDELAVLLGHASPEITRRFYRKWTVNMAATLAERIAAAEGVAIRKHTTEEAL